MIKIKKLIIFLPLALILVMPIFSFAQTITVNPGQGLDGGLVPCTNTPQITPGSGTTPGTVTYQSPCDFNAFMTLVNNVINFILFKLAMPIAAIMFFYAGFLLIKAQGGEAKTKAKEIFMNAVIGLVFIAAAWLIINTILSILGFQGAWIGFKP